MKNSNIRVLMIAFGLTQVLQVSQGCSSSVGFSTVAPEGSNGASSTGTIPTPVSTVIPAGTTAAQQVFKFGAVSSAIDILIVADNSGSMQLEQNVLANSFNNFIGGLAGVDWQIGVTTTDVSGASGQNFMGGNYVVFPAADGQLVGPADLYTSAASTVFGTQFILKPTTANVTTAFANTVQRTNSKGIYLEGSGDERAIYAANLAVSGSSNDAVTHGFFRDGANLAVVILSDEDERSCGGDVNRADCDGTGVTFDPLDYPESLIDNVAATFAGAKSLVVHSIVIKPGDSSCLSMEQTNVNGLGTGGKTGEVYAALSGMTGGTVSSICNVLTPGAFASDLSTISTSIANTVNPQTLTLGHTPAMQPEITIVSNVPGVPVDSTLRCTSAAGSQQVKCNKYPANSTVTVTYLY